MNQNLYRIVSLVAAVFVTMSSSVLSDVHATDETLNIEEAGARTNYSIGYQIGRDFRRQGVVINPEMVVRGIEDAIAGGQPLMQPPEMHATLTSLQRRVKAEQQQAQAGVEGRNIESAGSFLAQNAAMPGVVTLPSGLQYKVISSGAGKKPGATDTVTVHYRGTLIDGSEFDSSYSRNQPASFAVNRVIAGWTEALQLMQEGDKWLLFIPPGLAYGERGAGKRIPPNSALIFEVELLSVN